MVLICGRWVKVQTGSKTQTVNICHASQSEGPYEYVVRLRPPFLSRETLERQGFASIRELVRHLETRYGGVVERSPGGSHVADTNVPEHLRGVAEICDRYEFAADRSGLFSEMVEKIRENWHQFRKPDFWPTVDVNWVLRVAREYTREPDKHLEKQLQKRIAILMEGEGWGNDVVTSSGLMGSQGRHVNIDLAQRIEGGFVFIELKVSADDPYRAACQIARYGAIHMLYRLEPELRRRFGQHEMLRARQIVLEVLAPYDYYGGSGHDLRRLERQLDAEVSAFAAAHVPDLSLSFRFRSFPTSFTFHPDMDAALIRDAVQRRASPFDMAPRIVFGLPKAKEYESARKPLERIEMRGYAGQAIRTFADWEHYALPPERKAQQWKEHRSEYELARCWTASGDVAVPPAIRRLLDGHVGTEGTVIKNGFSQHETPLAFGDRAPRCHDLMLLGERNGRAVCICVESKADESFGGTLTKELERASKRAISFFPKRLDWLTRSLLDIPSFTEDGRLAESLADLRYQLFTAVAGTLIEAQSRQAGMAILIVHEFRTPATQDARLRENAEDLNRFLSILYPRNGGPEEAVAIQPGELLGPISMRGLFDGPLFIGKVRTG